MVESRLGLKKAGRPHDAALRRDRRERDLDSVAVTAADRVSWMELTGYMRNQLLRDSDVFSMAQGLELRVPLVDARLFATLSQIPARVRLRAGKRMLLEAVPEVPDWVRNRKKTGFRFPFQEWMEEGFGDLLDSVDSEPNIDLRAWYRRWTMGALEYRLRA
jgi:asparagine synthase (glutamine-hydrolysing)